MAVYFHNAWDQLLRYTETVFVCILYMDLCLLSDLPSSSEVMTDINFNNSQHFFNKIIYWKLKVG